MRERNHFDGRPHRYKAYCLCSSCVTETRKRVAQFWTQTPVQDRNVMLEQLKEKRNL